MLSLSWTDATDFMDASLYSPFQVLKEDIAYINENCVISSSHTPKSNVPVVVYRNRNRDAINTAIFEETIQQQRPFRKGNSRFHGLLGDVRFSQNLCAREKRDRIFTRIVGKILVGLVK
jgi:hypothetical protein